MARGLHLAPARCSSGVIRTKLRARTRFARALPRLSSKLPRLGPALGRLSLPFRADRRPRCVGQTLCNPLFQRPAPELRAAAATGVASDHGGCGAFTALHPLWLAGPRAHRPAFSSEPERGARTSGGSSPAARDALDSRSPHDDGSRSLPLASRETTRAFTIRTTFHRPGARRPFARPRAIRSNGLALDAVSPAGASAP